MNSMLTDYLSLKRSTSMCKPIKKIFHERFQPVKSLQSLQMKSHIFDRKDPWNWKFPQRSDTISQNTLNETKDQVKLTASHKLRTGRNQSLNLCSTDINAIGGSYSDRRLFTSGTRVPVSLQQIAENKAVSAAGRHRRPISAQPEIFNSLNCGDIDGAKPKKPPAMIVRSYASLRNDDIEGSLPRTNIRKQELLTSTLRTDDIDNCKPFSYNEKFKRKTPRNPLEPFEQPSPLGKKGRLKYFGPKPKLPFIRDNMLVDDIEGTSCRTKPKDRFITRNNCRSDDIPGAQTKFYHKVYYDKESYMGAPETPLKKISDLRLHKSNPLSPKYKMTNQNGEVEMIGEISGNRPKTYNYKRERVNSTRDNLYCSTKNVEWVPGADKYKPSLERIVRPRAGVNSDIANQTNLILETFTSRGKKQFHQSKPTLGGIMETEYVASNSKRFHAATKPPVPKFTRKKIKKQRPTAIIFTPEQTKEAVTPMLRQEHLETASSEHN